MKQSILSPFRFSLRNEEDNEVIDGGNTVFVDEEAPKEIHSGVIIEYHADFYCATRWRIPDSMEWFHFSVARNRDGILIASETGSRLEYPADQELLNRLQKVIAGNDLVKKNGLHDVTAGLAPEYAAGGLNVIYDSGETLRFTTDNDPYALWSEETYDVFADWFSEHGMNGLYPDEDHSPILSFWMEERENGRELSFFTQSENTKNSHPVLEMERCDLKKETVEEEKRIPIPKDYFQRITAILSAFHVARAYDFSTYSHTSGSFRNHEDGYFGMGPHSEKEEDSKDRFFLLHALYESGKRIHIETRKESELNGMKDLTDTLKDFHASLFSR